MNLFQKLEILDLQDNAIGSINNTLLPFAIQLKQLNRLYYLNLENNLIGAYPQDAQQFRNTLKENKNITINEEYNVSATKN